VRDIEVISNATIAKKRNELFKRIKTSTVAHLIGVEISNNLIGRKWSREHIQFK